MINRMIYYLILIPHKVEEGIQRKVVVGSCETRKCTNDGSSQENAMQMLLKPYELLLHYFVYLVIIIHMSQI